MKTLHTMMMNRSPLLRRGRLLLKAEALRAFPYAKARSAAYIVRAALESGADLSRVVDRSSGSWAMGLVHAVNSIGDGVQRDVVIITVGQPDPIVRASVLCAGGRFIIVDANSDRIDVLQQLVAKGWWSPDQHNNLILVKAFEKTLGAEILRNLDCMGISVEELGYLVAPVGTGATLAGVSAALRNACPSASFVSVGIDGMWSILHGGLQTQLRPGSRAPGMGSLDEECETLRFARRWIDEVVGVDSFRAQQELLNSFELVPTGFGMSSAYAIAYGKQELLTSAMERNPQGFVLVILPDGIARYTKELEAAIDLLASD